MRLGLIFPVQNIQKTCIPKIRNENGLGLIILPIGNESEDLKHNRVVHNDVIFEIIMPVSE